MARSFYYDDEEGVTEGRTVYMSDVESAVLGPDGEPVRKSFRQPIGFDLRPKATTKPIKEKRTWKRC